jgi:hypothetical protein
MLHKLEVLKQTNLRLSEELSKSEKNISDQERELLSWMEKYESLKLTNSILGSDEYKRETKLKINTLIREIDHCITQLAE